MTNIAIDGPSGAGKSTIARMVSSELGMVYIDTGAMYRSLALKALRMGIDIKTQHDNVIALLEDTKVDLRHTEQGQRILLDGEDVSDFIRSPEVSVGASDIAVIPEVRVFLVKLQQEIAAHTDCIMDGRDIGTCVLPHAEVKIFLTASVEARA
ncbi:MAG: (d)CMP kinase, partial [Ruminococcaceae bacterium]|nr:(d)CMP kinase [Oscillospiraceae bacterium]